MSSCLGKAIQINCFVDSDHAREKRTRQSQTRIFIYLNSVPINWYYSKGQSTVESSTLGLDFVALQIAAELIISLRSKLRMFGIPIEGAANLFCNKDSVYKSSILTETTLKEKHNSICFHRVRECIAAAILFVHKVDTADCKLSDMLTKSLPAVKQKLLRSRIMFNEETV